MRLLLGGPGDESALVEVPRTPPADRPWVLANMVASVDGATAVAGESRGLSGPADRRVFHRLRGVADAVMAAAGTVRADRYGPARPSDEVRAARAARGQDPVPPIVVVSRTLALPWDAPLFTQAAVPTVVLAPEDAPAEARTRAGGAGADVICAGRGDVDLAAALAALRARGVRVLLCEGGPGLIGALAAGGLLDELYASVSPLLVSGDAGRMLRGPVLDPPRRLRLLGAGLEDDFLFLRYGVVGG